MSRRIIIPMTIGIVSFIALIVSACTVCRILKEKCIQGTPVK